MDRRLDFDRRGFLRASALTAAGVGFLNGLCPSAVHADALTREMRDAMTPDDILTLMRRGNERFRAGEQQHHNYLAQQRASIGAQFPAAVILSCIDSRAPAEVIMDLGIGDTFNARVAGNVLNPDILGSMEFACKLSGARIAMVMGHTSCGAIKGAIDGAELGHLTALLAKIRPAVEATKFEGERSAKNPAFVDAVARKHVELMMLQVREQSALLREMEAQGKVDIAGAMYNLETAALDIFV